MKIPEDAEKVTEYLVSRFYRAPEIILGCQLDQKADVWSVGVSIFELFTGKLLFDGRSNSEVLKQIVLLRGRIPQKLIKRSQAANKYFSENSNEMYYQEFNENSGQFTRKSFEIP